MRPETYQRLIDKQARDLKVLIDQGFEPELSQGGWGEHHLRRIGYAEVKFSPNRSAYDREPYTNVRYTGPHPVYDRDEGRLIRPGEMLGEWE